MRGGWGHLERITVGERDPPERFAEFRPVRRAIQTQVRLSLSVIGAMAFEAVVRQDRPNLAVEIGRRYLAAGRRCQCRRRYRKRGQSDPGQSSHGSLTVRRR
jgi:hypothetical protein